MPAAAEARGGEAGSAAGGGGGSGAPEPPRCREGRGRPGARVPVVPLALGAGAGPPVRGCGPPGRASPPVCFQARRQNDTMDAGGGPLLPDSVLYEIFLYLDHVDVLSVGLVCQQWHAVARDEFLWKELFYRYYRVSREVPRHPGALAGGKGAGGAAAGLPAERAGRRGRPGGCSLNDGPEPSLP